ncbi:MAG: hypothetical protein JWN49_655 [Parcubacteria group bacterium]|nr:hypothetical protein [Parcubacteria group bacterium]
MAAYTHRILRSCEQRARKLHRCDYCDELIFPGDIYGVSVALVTVGTYKYVEIRKEHSHPPCPHDPEDDPPEMSVFILDIFEFRLAA